MLRRRRRRGRRWERERRRESAEEDGRRSRNNIEGGRGVSVHRVLGSQLYGSQGLGSHDVNKKQLPARSPASWPGEKEKE